MCDPEWEEVGTGVEGEGSTWRSSSSSTVSLSTPAIYLLNSN